MLVSASRSGHQCNFIMLRAPNGSFSADNNLSLENAFDSLFDRFPGALTTCFIDKNVIALIAGDITQESHYAHHRLIVEGDVLVVTFLDRVIRGPTSAGELRSQKIINSE